MNYNITQLVFPLIFISFLYFYFRSRELSHKDITMIAIVVFIFLCMADYYCKQNSSVIENYTNRDETFGLTFNAMRYDDYGDKDDAFKVNFSGDPFEIDDDIDISKIDPGNVSDASRRYGDYHHTDETTDHLGIHDFHKRDSSNITAHADNDTHLRNVAQTGRIYRQDPSFKEYDIDPISGKQVGTVHPEDQILVKHGQEKIQKVVAENVQFGEHRDAKFDLDEVIAHRYEPYPGRHYQEYPDDTDPFNLSHSNYLTQYENEGQRLSDLYNRTKLVNKPPPPLRTGINVIPNQSEQIVNTYSTTRNEPIGGPLIYLNTYQDTKRIAERIKEINKANGGKVPENGMIPVDFYGKMYVKV